MTALGSQVTLNSGVVSSPKHYHNKPKDATKGKAKQNYRVMKSQLNNLKLLDVENDLPLLG